MRLALSMPREPANSPSHRTANESKMESALVSIAKDIRAGLNPDRRALSFDECVASGQSCSYGPHGRRGELQCAYCGKEKSNLSNQEVISAADVFASKSRASTTLWAWVPVEPTLEMVEAGRIKGISKEQIRRIYSTMIKSSPKGVDPNQEDADRWRAAIAQPWVLASIPKDQGGGIRITINLYDVSPTPDMEPEDAIDSIRAKSVNSHGQERPPTQNHS